jgi:[ribosomal protein S18]-alanine N-acetyltransferase
MMPAQPSGAWVLEPMTLASVPVVAALERQAHAHPWTEHLLRDSVLAGHWCQLLVRASGSDDPPECSTAPVLADGRWLLGYVIAMLGYCETHLLSIATAPPYRHQGCARYLLAALRQWSQAQQAECVWLEVRASNTGARALYERLGFEWVGRRRDYYPSASGQREDALIMNWPLPNRAQVVTEEHA